MNSNELKAELIRLGALQRLSTLNKERDELYKILGYNEKGRIFIDPKKLLDGVKEYKTKGIKDTKVKKWSKEQRAKFMATMRKKMGKE